MLPELGTSSRREISVLIGAALISSPARCAAAEQHLEGELPSVQFSISALVGTRHNPVINEFYTCWVAAEKLKSCTDVLHQKIADHHERNAETE